MLKKVQFRKERPLPPNGLAFSWILDNPKSNSQVHMSEWVVKCAIDELTLHGHVEDSNKSGLKM